MTHINLLAEDFSTRTLLIIISKNVSTPNSAEKKEDKTCNSNKQNIKLVFPMQKQLRIGKQNDQCLFKHCLLFVLFLCFFQL